MAGKTFTVAQIQEVLAAHGKLVAQYRSAPTREEKLAVVRELRQQTNLNDIIGAEQDDGLFLVAIQIALTAGEFDRR
jgi:hypothetical protein